MLGLGAFARLLHCCKADMQAGGRQMLTRIVLHPCFACAVAESLAVPHEEVNRILVAIVAVRHSILTKQAGCLREQVACFGALCRFAQLLC